MHDFVRAATALAPPHLSLDVAINRARRLAAVFAGPLPAAHDAACAYVRSTAVREVGAPFDVVVATNGGYPLDRNLYQAVKGMAAAERMVRDGGTIVMAAACGDGVPARRCVRPAAGRRGHAGRPGRRRRPTPELDRWQAQVLGRVLARAEVRLHTGGSTTAPSPPRCSSRPPTSTAPSRGPWSGSAPRRGRPSSPGPAHRRRPLRPEGLRAAHTLI